MADRRETRTSRCGVFGRRRLYLIAKIPLSNVTASILLAICFLLLLISLRRRSHKRRRGGSSRFTGDATDPAEQVDALNAIFPTRTLVACRKRTRFESSSVSY